MSRGTIIALVVIAAVLILGVLFYQSRRISIQGVTPLTPTVIPTTGVGTGGTATPSGESSTVQPSPSEMPSVTSMPTHVPTHVPTVSPTTY